MGHPPRFYRRESNTQLLEFVGSKYRSTPESQNSINDTYNGEYQCLGCILTRIALCEPVGGRKMAPPGPCIPPGYDVIVLGFGYQLIPAGETELVSHFRCALE